MGFISEEMLLPAIWLILTIAFVVIEAMTTGIVTIWFAIGALASFVIALCDGALWLQIVCFIVVSVVLLVFTRKIFVQKLNTGKEKTNVDAMAGKSAIVMTTVSKHNVGTVKVGSQEWAAIPLEDTDVFEAGQEVQVEKVVGVKLVVTGINK